MTKPPFVRTRTGIEIGLTAGAEELPKPPNVPVVEHYRKPIDPDIVIGVFCAIVLIGLLAWLLIERFS